jgi:hypothetical protein
LLDVFAGLTRFTDPMGVFLEGFVLSPLGSTERAESGCLSRRGSVMRVLAIGLAIAVIVFVVTAGHVLFLPLLFLPFGLFSFGQHRRRETNRRDQVTP